LLPDPKTFPSGIKALADYVHRKGLKLGLYSDAGKFTCQVGPGSLYHENDDVALFASRDSGEVFSFWFRCQECSKCGRRFVNSSYLGNIYATLVILKCVCSDGAGSACWARTKEHRSHALVPYGGDAAPPMLYTLRWRRCTLGSQDAFQGPR